MSVYIYAQTHVHTHPHNKPTLNYIHGYVAIYLLGRHLTILGQGGLRHRRVSRKHVWLAEHPPLSMHDSSQYATPVDLSIVHFEPERHVRLAQGSSVSTRITYNYSNIITTVGQSIIHRCIRTYVV